MRAATIHSTRSRSRSASDEDQIEYLMEHQAEFRGVKIQQVFLRDYPLGSRAAQILGYVGEISPSELKRLTHEGYRVGRQDRQVRSRGGIRRVSARRGRRGPDHGQLARSAAGPADAEEGGANRARRFGSRSTSKLQQAAEEALRFGIATAKANKSYYADGGAIVAMDPRGRRDPRDCRRIRRTSRRSTSAGSTRRRSLRSSTRRPRRRRTSPASTASPRRSTRRARSGSP